MRWRRLAAVGAIGLGAAALGLRAALFLPPDRLDVPVACPADAPLLPRGAPLRVLVWNIQFAGGRHAFFYDGGDVVSVPVDEVLDNVDRIAAVVRRYDPDVVLWQEVDRGSRRTGHVDQLAALQERLDLPCHTATPYHRAPYVPHPSHEHLGRVDMNLAVSSRYRLEGAVRWQLPLLRESAVRRLFNLRRALLEVRLPLQEGGALTLLNTHLSAFSRGDGTLPRQVAVVAEHVDRLEARGAPWLLAGDFNALPPGDSPERLPEHARALYAESSTPIAPLFDRGHAAASADEYARAGAALRTYVPLGAETPDRTLDYVFRGGVEQRAFRVLHGHGDASDHLPLWIEVVVP